MTKKQAMNFSVEVNLLSLKKKSVFPTEGSTSGNGLGFNPAIEVNPSFCRNFFPA